MRFEGEERNAFRLFFLLPTTGTATEQYKDYALEAGIEDTALTHSRAPIDLEQIAETSEIEEASENAGHDTSRAAREALKAKKDKAEALELWSTRLIVGTTDTVLGLMANALRSVCALPAIVSSAIVFDEIHAYDEQMFGHLLVFLKNFPRLPVLLMTASLPEIRLRAIKQVRTDLAEKDIIKDAGNFETWPRYRINMQASDDEVWARIESTIAQDGKVLWVRNQVEWANEIYRECRERFATKYDVSFDIYHSRLCYIHRSQRHRRVIDRFKAEIKKGGIKEKTKGAILVATQVAEMSLDLSADLLITDIGPVTALIQRLGRLNRLPKPSCVKWAYVRPLPTDKKNPKRPYEDKENFEEIARDWLRLLTQPERDLNQENLACAFARVEGEPQGDFDIERAEEAAYFFSGLWQTKPGTTRGGGYTVSVILKEHLEQCNQFDRRGEPAREWVRRWEVPITFHDEILGWERRGGVFVAPKDAIGYDYKEQSGEGTGAYWKR
jgi:CRISPR-associated endonuclease/helicase Cas3